MNKDIDKMSERELRQELRDLRLLVRSLSEALEIHEGVSMSYYLRLGGLFPYEVVEMSRDYELD